MDEAINVEQFICEVECRPAIWNCSADEYSNKLLKRQAWEEIVLLFEPRFITKSPGEKNDLLIHFQRKWKSLRDCYSRELSRRRKEKRSGSVPTGRKQYTYFERLAFLELGTKAAKASLDGDMEDGNEDEQENGDEESRPVLKRKISCKKEQSEEDKVDDILKTKVLKVATKAREDHDEDTMFMLSLVPELKKCPEAIKLDIMSDLINVFKKSRMQQYMNAIPLQYAHGSPPFGAALPMANPPVNHFNFYPYSNPVPSQGPSMSPAPSSSRHLEPEDGADHPTLSSSKGSPT